MEQIQSNLTEQEPQETINITAVVIVVVAEVIMLLAIIYAFSIM